MDLAKKTKLENSVPAGSSKRLQHFNAFNWNCEIEGQPPPPPQPKPTLSKISSFSSNFPTQLIITGKKNERQDESIKAIQNRVLELFVREKPDMTAAPLPAGVIFQRSHMVVGIFDMVIDIMERHVPTDFFSPILISYLLTGLADNLALYKSMWLTPGMADTNKTRIVSLILKYAANNVKKQNALFAKLGGDSV